MHPEDRVLVGVISRKKDFAMARDHRWYRIPQGKAEKGIYAEYMAFFFSRAFGELNSAIHYYARRTGVELLTRRELLPDEANHPRADDVYYKIQLGELKAKAPPIKNAKKRRFSFIYTTWDRFIHATDLVDLYSEADYLVDRVYHALEDSGLRPQRSWEFENAYPQTPPQVKVLCEDGEVVATPHVDDIASEADLNRAVERIKREIEERGGPRMLSLPFESE